MYLLGDSGPCSTDIFYRVQFKIYLIQFRLRFFYQYSFFIQEIVIIKATPLFESMLPGILFSCDRNLVSFGDVLLRFCLKNDQNNDKL